MAKQDKDGQAPERVALSDAQKRVAAKMLARYHAANEALQDALAMAAPEGDGWAFDEPTMAFVRKPAA